jgi:cytochrome c553
MNRAFFSALKSLSLAALAATSIASIAYASDAAKAPKADITKGEALFANGDPARGVIACSSCHGTGGNSVIPTNPKLSGQHAAYTAKQLHDFKGPDRAGTLMTAFAGALTPEDVANVSAYLSTQKSSGGVAKNKATIELGKKIYRGGIAEKSVPACAGCHGPAGAGIPAQYARVAGQHQEYLVAQLINFSKGTRNNSAQMVTISKRLSEDEMKAVADYIAGLK